MWLQVVLLFIVLSMCGCRQKHFGSKTSRRRERPVLEFSAHAQRVSEGSKSQTPRNGLSKEKVKASPRPTSQEHKSKDGNEKKSQEKLREENTLPLELTQRVSENNVTDLVSAKDVSNADEQLKPHPKASKESPADAIETALEPEPSSGSDTFKYVVSIRERTAKSHMT